MARATTWRSSVWARWLGWTMVFAVALSVLAAALLWRQSPLPAPGEGLTFAGLFGLAVLAFGIGLRFPNWSWVLGVSVVNVLLAATVVRFVDLGPPKSGSEYAALGLTILFAFHFLLSLAGAAAGVLWGWRHSATNVGSTKRRLDGDASV